MVAAAAVEEGAWVVCFVCVFAVLEWKVEVWGGTAVVNSSSDSSTSSSSDSNRNSGQWRGLVSTQEAKTVNIFFFFSSIDPFFI